MCVYGTVSDGVMLWWYLLAPTQSSVSVGGPNAGHITCSVCSFLPQLYTYCYHNCTNVGSEMVSMVMVAITTVLNYNTSNRNGFS